MYIILYETKRPSEPREIRAKPRTYTDMAAAEAAQRQVAHDFRCAAWIAEIPDPPLIEAVSDPLYSERNNVQTIQVPGGTL